MDTRVTCVRCGHPSPRLPFPYAPIYSKHLRTYLTQSTTKPLQEPSTMSTLTHTPSHIRSPTDYVAFRSRKLDQDASFSPRRATSQTPPRRPFITNDSPLLMLTPSPLRRRPERNDRYDMPMNLDFSKFAHATDFDTPFHKDSFFTSSPNASRRSDQQSPCKRKGPTRDEGEGSFLLEDMPPRIPLFPSHVANSPIVSPTNATKRKVVLVTLSVDII